MFWADKIVDEIIKSKKHTPYWVDDMKTPSGRVHVGALRGVIVHDLVFKVLKEKGKDVAYTYVFNDMDPMDGFPQYLPKDFKKHMGKPLFQIPSPEKGYESMARCYGGQFINVFHQLDTHPKIIWSSEYYKAGKFNDVIRETLDNVDIIRKLYHDISGYDKPRNWYPFQVICPGCGKVGTTLVTGWDGEKITFLCKKDLVDWAQGCGYKDKISPFNGTGKLMWKVDWAAHWKVVGITIEGAGKDHMSEGGSHDLSSAISKQALNYPAPYAFSYEWFLAKGGKKMSSSKGIGTSASEISRTVPPELLRFLLVRTPYKKAIIFDPSNNQTILDLFDEYDRFAYEFWKHGKETQWGKIWKLSQVDEKIPNKMFLPRFRDVVNYVQSPSVNINEKFAEIKGSALTAPEKKELEKRIKYAKIWIKTYAPKEMSFQVTKDVPKEAAKLTDEQKQYLGAIVDILEKDWDDPEKLQQALYKKSKELGVATKKAFQAIYISFLGKSYGPKAAWFLLSLSKSFIIKRLKEVQEVK